MKKKKILISNKGYKPAIKYGGPVSSVENLTSLLDDDFECYVITRDHDLGDTKKLCNIIDGFNLVKNVKVSYLSEENINYAQIKTLFDEIKPDVLYINDFFDGKFTIPLLKLAKINKTKTIISIRGQLNYGAFKKKYKKIPYLIYLKSFNLLKDVKYHSTSTEETNSIIKYLTKNTESIKLIENIPFNNLTGINHKEKNSNELSMIFLSRIHKKKNLLYILNVLEKIKFNVSFDIYGPTEDEEYWNKCLDKISKLPNNIKVEYKGVISNDESCRILSYYDLFVLPTLNENFGHAIVESMMVGTPVLISDNTPWNDLTPCANGWSLPLDEINSYVDAINYMFKINAAEYKRLSEDCKTYIKSKIDIDELKIKYKELFNN